jgi:hypothetical protein
MSFCSNCGQSLAAQPSSEAPHSGSADLPPTMLSYNPTPQTPPPTSPFTPAPSFSPPPSSPPPPAKKGGKGLLIGILGCSGLLLVSLVGGLVVGIPVLQSSGVLPQPLFGGVPTPSPDSNSNINNTNSLPNNSNSNISPNNSGEGEKMLAELQTAKQVGAFRQTDARIIPAKDYFPLATDAVQATYTNGSQSVYWTIGKFVSNQDAQTNFNDQVNNVKANGGTIYSNTTKDGTQAAAYKNSKNYYFLETTTGNSGSRIHSSNLAALQSFSSSLGTAFSSSSNTSQTSSGLAGIWKGTFSGSPTTLLISKHNGDTFEGTLVRNDGTVVQFVGQLNSATRAISMKETKVLKQPKEGTWTLGENTGTLSENGRSMSGTGRDNVNPPYNWSFTKQ